MLFKLKTKYMQQRSWFRAIIDDRAPWICLVVAGVLIAGCNRSGRRTYPAGGKVTFSGGNPLTKGLVTFRLADDPEPLSARGQIQADGKFQLTTFEANDGAVAGRYQALVMVPIIESDGPAAKPPINYRFSNYGTSKLEFTVTDDPQKNQFNIIVTK